MTIVNDLMSGLSYCAMTSRPKSKPKRAKHHSTLGEGLVIAATFIGGTLLMFIVA